MRMNDMVKWLEDRGYQDVSKKYDNDMGKYLFTASKGVCTYKRWFKYPDSYASLEKRQLDFLDHFDNVFDKYCCVDCNRVSGFFKAMGFDARVNNRLDSIYPIIDVNIPVRKLGGVVHTFTLSIDKDALDKESAWFNEVKTLLDALIGHSNIYDRKVAYEMKIPTCGKNLLEPASELTLKYKQIEDDCKRVFNSLYGRSNSMRVPEIKDVIFNAPATIVFWADGTKTVVKANGDDDFNPEVGLAMAISKKALGNNHDYYEPFKKWVGRYEKKQRKAEKEAENILKDVRECCFDGILKEPIDLSVLDIPAYNTPITLSFEGKVISEQGENDHVYI